MTKKGQTPLEYLLIAIVGIVIVVSVIIFMNTSTSTTGGEVANKTNEYICRSTACYDETNCENLEACQLSGYVNCSGQVYTESGIIPGHCSSMNSPPICNPTSLGVLKCSDFNVGYDDGSSGPITCLAGGYKFNLSECCSIGTFVRAIDKNDFNSLIGWTASEDVLATGNGIRKLCIPNPASCIGLTMTVLSGPLSGNSYSLADYGTIGGSPRTYYPIFGTDFVGSVGWPGVNLAPPWNYKICGYTEAPPKFVPTCGNNLAELPIGEQCDGTDLRGKGCADLGLGYIGGTLSCMPPLDPDECKFNTSDCYYYDGIIDFIRNADPSECAKGLTDDFICARPFDIDLWYTPIGRKLAFLTGPEAGNNYTLRAMPCCGATTYCTNMNGGVWTMDFATNGMDLCGGGCNTAQCLMLGGSQIKMYDA